MEVTAYLYNALYDPFEHVVRGKVFGDKRKRFEDGAAIRTSSVVKLGTDEVQTLNSNYRVINWMELS